MIEPGRGNEPVGEDLILQRFLPGICTKKGDRNSDLFFAMLEVCPFLSLKKTPLVTYNEPDIVSILWGKLLLLQRSGLWNNDSSNAIFSVYHSKAYSTFPYPLPSTVQYTNHCHVSILRHTAVRMLYCRSASMRVLRNNVRIVSIHF